VPYRVRGQSYSLLATRYSLLATRSRPDRLANISMTIRAGERRDDARLGGVALANK